MTRRCERARRHDGDDDDDERFLVLVLPRAVAFGARESDAKTTTTMMMMVSHYSSLFLRLFEHMTSTGFGGLLLRSWTPTKKTTPTALRGERCSVASSVHRRSSSFSSSSASSSSQRGEKFPVTRHFTTRLRFPGRRTRASSSESFEAMPPSSESNGGKNGVLLTCIHWVQKQVQNARNAAPLLKWPDAVLFSKETAKDVTRNAMVILVGLCVFTAMLGCIDWCIVAFRSWVLNL